MKKSFGIARKISYMALLIATDVVLTRLCINLPTVKIGFGFFATVIAAILYGPIYAGAEAAIADITGAFLFPTGPYFPGFTVTALLSGIVYGIFLHKKVNTVRVVLSIAIIAVLFSVLLNTYFLTFVVGKGFIALLPKRIIQAMIMIPIQFFGCFAADKTVKAVLSENMR